MVEQGVLVRLSDGRELLLPVYLDTWVVVPRSLAHEQRELAWTLEFHDAPEGLLEEALERLDADPADFIDGALLVRLEDWRTRSAAGQREAAELGEPGDLGVVPRAESEPAAGDEPSTATGDHLLLAPRVIAGPRSGLVRRPETSRATSILPVTLLACYLLAFGFCAAVVISFLLSLRGGAGFEEWVAGSLLVLAGWAITRLVAALVEERPLAWPFAVLTLAIPTTLVFS